LAEGLGQVEDEGLFRGGGLGRFGGFADDAAPGAGDALGQACEIRAEAHVPATIGREECQGFFEKREQVTPRLIYEEGHPFGVGEIGFGEDGGPAGVAGDFGPLFANSRRAVALWAGARLGEKTDVTIPGRVQEPRPTHEPGGAAAREFGGVEDNVVCVLVGAVGIVEAG